FHKWLQVPYDAGFLLVRDSTLHQDTFSSPATYLQREVRGLAAGSPWPCDLGPDLSRGFKALKTWFTLQVYGAKKLGKIIDGTCELARYLSDRIEATPELELLTPVSLNIVCFRYPVSKQQRANLKIKEEEIHQLNADLVADVQESGVAAPSTTWIDGQLAIRVAIFNHRTSVEDIDGLLNAIISKGKARTHNWCIDY
ncbi:MAG: hypothetical protein JKY67_10535, partial [Pseudomonadales bacterium]|nr:hypothetical protein [Pseudomonadales bacterium]